MTSPAYRWTEEGYVEMPDMQTHYDRRESPRASVLDEAKTLITGDRNAQYGPPTQDFQRAADVMNGLGYRALGGKPIAPHDVAVLVMAVKLSRLMHSPEKRDSWVDLAGYAGCGYECAVTGPNQDLGGRLAMGGP